MPIKATRALLAAALDGSLNGALFRRDDNFGFEVPVSRAGRRRPRSSTRARPGPTGRPMTAQARKLVDMFIANFAKFESHVDGGVRDAAPGLRIAAEWHHRRSGDSRETRPRPGFSRRGLLLPDRHGIRFARACAYAGPSGLNGKVHGQRSAPIKGSIVIAGWELVEAVRAAPAARRPERQQGLDRRAALLRPR